MVSHGRMLRRRLSPNFGELWHVRSERTRLYNDIVSLLVEESMYVSPLAHSAPNRNALADADFALPSDESVSEGAAAAETERRRTIARNGLIGLNLWPSHD